MAKKRVQDALDYHSDGRRGKIEVVPTKPYSSQRDLSLAYSPGVAEPCLAIADNKEDVYKYTIKGNLVAVISDGTAVLGLGDIGPEASKPVMEGKALLFKIFADIDVFDIELDTKDADEFVRTVKAMAPTFGGINLEDIKAPQCFEIERRLKEELDIPVMHDDQHGTAIISAAGLLNALEIAKKKIGDVKIVVSGAGASAQTCAKLYLSLGAKKEKIFMLDSKGVIRKSRTDIDEMKRFFANDTEKEQLADVIVDADVFLGLSRGNVLSVDMVKTMAPDPIVFALANPTPEIAYDIAIGAREDIIMATGRSDHPNQVNNVLGFPFIFRGALDVRATTINEEMKLAAVTAIADLAKQVVPESVNEAYHTRNLVFGRHYIIPKPLDPRLICAVAPAVAKAAMESGVAQQNIEDWAKYEQDLNKRLGQDSKLIRSVTERARRNPKKVVFAEAEHYKTLKAAEIVRDEGIAEPILLGRFLKVKRLITENNLDLEGVTIIDPRSEDEEDRRRKFAEDYYDKRKRKGWTLFEAMKAMRDRRYFGASMVEDGQADALISGITRNYPDAIRPALQVIGKAEGKSLIAGMYILITKRGPMFFADTTVNKNPNAEDLAQITLLTAEAIQRFKIEPAIAMLSYSNFGSSKGEEPDKIRKAVSYLHENYPELKVDGEVQANFALNKELTNEIFPFSNLAEADTNALIFPNLASGNIAYKLIQEMTSSETIGPILLGMKKAVHVLPLGCSVREIVNVVTIAVVDAQTREE